MKRIRDDLGYFGIETLAHFGSAVVQHNRSVVINMDQRARLVIPRCGKGDAEFDGGKGNSFADNPAFGIMGQHGFAPRLIVAIGFKFANEAIKDIVLNLLMIGR